MKSNKQGYKKTNFGLIPTEWNICKFGEIIEYSQYGLSKTTSINGNYPIFKMNNFKNGRVVNENLDKVKISKKEFEEFKLNRDSLQEELYEIYTKALETKGYASNKMPDVKVTVQGGVGTAEEQYFLLDYYNVDSVGWGTPFLLVPEAVNVDEHTLNLLADAKEDDLYTSKVSPLGVLFNNVRGNTMDIKKMKLIAEGKPGSNCPNGNAAIFSDEKGKPICKASRKYQKQAIAELDAKGLDTDSYKKEFDAIVEPACICNSLGTTAKIVNGIELSKTQGTEVAVCPGPSMAYFSKKVSLKTMTNHICQVRLTRCHLI